MKGKISYIIIIGAMVGLFGCSATKAIVPDPVSNPSTETGKIETVLASGTVNLSLDNTTKSDKTSLESKTLTVKDATDVSVDIGNLTNFEMYNTIKFSVVELDKVEASGKILLNIVYNDLAISTSDYKLKVYIDSGEGFVGISNTASILPVYAKIKTNDAYTQVSSSGFALKTWSKPTGGWSSPIDEVLEIKLQGDFKQAMRQGYKTKLCIDFIQVSSI